MSPGNGTSPRNNDRSHGLNHEVFIISSRLINVSYAILQILYSDRDEYFVNFVCDLPDTAILSDALIN